MESTFDKNVGLLTFQFAGRMDTPSSNDAAEIVAQEVNTRLSEVGGSLQVKFDLAQTTYVASSFFRVCLATAKQLSPGYFSIVNTAPAVKKVFKIAALDEIFAVS